MDGGKNFLKSQSLLRQAMMVLALCAPALAASEDARARLGSGLKLFDLERYSEAAKEFELALRSDPHLEDARYHLAVSYFNQRRYREAQEQFEALLSSGYQKDWVTYYLARLDLIDLKLESAISRFQSLLERPEPLQDELYYLGSAYMKNGQPPMAISVLRRAVEFNSRDFRAHDLLARAYVKTGQPQEAEREFEESRRLHEYYLKGKEELMACRSRLTAGQADQAWAACGGVLESDDIDKLVAVGMLFGEFGLYDRALTLFLKALRLDPDSAEVNYDLALTYFQKKEYPQARKFLEVATRLRPNFFEALALSGTVFYVLREDDAALQVLRRAHQFRPDDPAVNRLLAQLERGGPR